MTLDERLKLLAEHGWTAEADSSGRVVSMLIGEHSMCCWIAGPWPGHERPVSAWMDSASGTVMIHQTRAEDYTFVAFLEKLRAPIVKEPAVARGLFD